MFRPSFRLLVSLALPVFAVAGANAQSPKSPPESSPEPSRHRHSATQLRLAVGGGNSSLGSAIIGSVTVTHEPRGDGDGFFVHFADLDGLGFGSGGGYVFGGGERLSMAAAGVEKRSAHGPFFTGYGLGAGVSILRRDPLYSILPSGVITPGHQSLDPTVLGRLYAGVHFGHFFLDLEGAAFVGRLHAQIVTVGVGARF